jgi:ABC-type Mn2+/Zn2+ transport system permease subunit
MIQGFVDSWWLFQNAYLAGWLMAVVLAIAGVLVVARDQIFIGAAVSNVSMLGITLGIRTGGALPFAWAKSDNFYTLWGVLFAVVGAAVTARADDIGRESREAVTGWVFLLGISGSVLIASHSIQGLEEVHRLIASTIIGARSADVAVFAVLTVLSVAAVAANRQRLLLLVMDPEMARAAGISVSAWNAMIWLWIGVVVSLSIRVAGITYAFSCLVLPGLIAKNVCREAGQIFLVAPLAAVGSAVVGFVVANHYDYPPGQTVGAIQCLLLACAWSTRALRTG